MDIHLHLCQDNYEIISKVYSPTYIFITFEKPSKNFTLKSTLNLLLHVSVYDHHHGAYARAWLKLYENSVKFISLYAM